MGGASLGYIRVGVFVTLIGRVGNRLPIARNCLGRLARIVSTQWALRPFGLDIYIYVGFSVSLLNSESVFELKR